QNIHKGMENFGFSLVSIKKRLLFLSISIVFFLAVLVGRLFFVQIVQNGELTKRASEQWYRDLPLQAPRGKIVSTNGDTIADNKSVYTVYVRPRAVKDVHLVSQYLSDLLQVDEDKLQESIKKAGVSEITIKRNVPVEIAELLKDLRLDGVYFTLDSQRQYPNGTYLSQVLGFTNIDNQGQGGLEAYYDRYLRGVNGFSYTGTDMKGIELKNNVTRYVPSIPGLDLVTSVDSNIQHFVEDAVTGAMQEWKSKSASMMVYDMTTGGVVASATAPSFDPNNPPRDDLELLNTLSKNQMITDVYEPGSTFKIFTLAAALDAGLADFDDTFFCPGFRVVDGQRIKCWRTKGHGTQTLQEGVNNSCNCMFMDLAQRLGVDRLYDYLHRFGFGQKSGIDFFGESRGIMLNSKNVKMVDLVRIGFGQTIAVTTLQMVSAVGAAVSGILYQPHFVEQVDDKKGQAIYQFQKNQIRKPIKAETAQKMTQILGTVVAQGSGKKAQVSGYPVGGKTGTAQKFKNGVLAQGKYVSSFVGFAPVTNPKYVALLTVDEPGGYVYYGSMTAAPYVGQVFDKVAKSLGVMQRPINPQTIAIPNLYGLSYVEASAKLKALGLQFETTGEGDKVIGTLPAPKEMVAVGDVVLLRLDD
ncbi:MAG: penicillin-binding transpeptidase domain-containing protein, partial [Firmicutes bacterium]|nr:penicillin-binding transpeptidase domain-containing protein [Bacillota bacterium]